MSFPRGLTAVCIWDSSVTLIVLCGRVFMKVHMYMSEQLHLYLLYHCVLDTCMFVWKLKINARYLLLSLSTLLLRQDLSLNQAKAEAWHTSFYLDRLANEL